MGFYTFDQIDGLRYSKEAGKLVHVKSQMDGFLDVDEIQAAIEKYTNTISTVGGGDVQESALQALPDSIKQFFGPSRVQTQKKETRKDSYTDYETVQKKKWIECTDGHGHSCDDGHWKHDKHAVPGHWEYYTERVPVTKSRTYTVTVGTNMINTNLLAKAVAAGLGRADGRIDRNEFKKYV